MKFMAEEKRSLSVGITSHRIYNCSQLLLSFVGSLSNMSCWPQFELETCGMLQLFRGQELETKLVQRGFAKGTFSTNFRNSRIFTSGVICQLIYRIRVLVSGLDLTCNGGSCRGNITKKSSMSFAFEKAPRISLSCKLVQYRECKNGILS